MIFSGLSFISIFSPSFAADCDPSSESQSSHVKEHQVFSCEVESKANTITKEPEAVTWDPLPEFPQPLSPEIKEHQGVAWDAKSKVNQMTNEPKDFVWDVESKENQMTKEPQGVKWQVLPDSDDNSIDLNLVEWHPVSEFRKEAEAIIWTVVTQENDSQLSDPFDSESSEKSTTPIQTTRPLYSYNSGPTYANYRALWRDGLWLPQISKTVPVGYGPKGLMLSFIINHTDCTLGKGPCDPFTTIEAWKDSYSTQSNGEFFQALGFGDPVNAVSLIVTNSLEKVPSDLNAGTLDSNILQGAQTGLHLAKAIGPDTSFRLGVENLITWDTNDYIYADMTRNFYFVGSQRIRINQDNSSLWFRNLYITAGIGNGEFKPIEQTFKDQTQALRDAGCETYGYIPNKPCSTKTFKRALRDGSDYGNISPIASIGLEVYDGFNLITEWTGRNLNAGFSWVPIPELGLVITPMFESLIPNCEYPGCKVRPISGYPDNVSLPSAVLTERPRLSIQVSLEFKF